MMLSSFVFLSSPNMSNLLYFEWSKNRNGYELLLYDPNTLDWNENGTFPTNRTPESTIRLLKLLTPGLQPSPDHKNTFLFIAPQSLDEPMTIKPLEENPALFKQFSKLPLTPEAVKNFANQNGLLNSNGRPELVDNWYKAIRVFQNAVSSMDKAKRAGDLGRWIDAFNRDFNQAPLFGGRSKTAVILRRSTERTQPSLHLSPFSLVDALWLQLAQHACSSRGLQSCKWCAKWFVFGTGTGRRSSAHYCSDRCRKAQHKNEKETNI